ncbi:hypothetical protein QTN25_002280 [Entamoeba marina]
MLAYFVFFLCISCGFADDDGCNCENRKWYGECKECNDGCYLDDSGTFTECRKCDSTCLTCKDNDSRDKTRCSSCDTDRYLSGESCISCSTAMDGCSTCSSSSTCTSCDSNYVLSGVSCLSMS